MNEHKLNPSHSIPSNAPPRLSFRVTHLRSWARQFPNSFSESIKKIHSSTLSDACPKLLNFLPNHTKVCTSESWKVENENQSNYAQILSFHRRGSKRRELWRHRAPILVALQLLHKAQRQASCNPLLSCCLTCRRMLILQALRHRLAFWKWVLQKGWISSLFSDKKLDRNTNVFRNRDSERWRCLPVAWAMHEHFRVNSLSVFASLPRGKTGLDRFLLVIHSHS